MWRERKYGSEDAGACNGRQPGIASSAPGAIEL